MGYSDNYNDYYGNPKSGNADKGDPHAWSIYGGKENANFKVGPSVVSASMKAMDPKKGLTLGELMVFINGTRDAGLSADTPVRIVVGWGSQIKEIKADHG